MREDGSSERNWRPRHHSVSPETPIIPDRPRQSPITSPLPNGSRRHSHWASTPVHAQHPFQPAPPPHGIASVQAVTSPQAVQHPFNAAHVQGQIGEHSQPATTVSASTNDGAPGSAQQASSNATSSSNFQSITYNGAPLFTAALAPPTVSASTASHTLGISTSPAHINTDQGATPSPSPFVPIPTPNFLGPFKLSATALGKRPEVDPSDASPTVEAAAKRPKPTPRSSTRKAAAAAAEASASTSTTSLPAA